MAIEKKHNEEDTLRKIALGDHRAFCLLFDHYERYIYGLGRKLTRSDDQAVELVQEVFLNVWADKEKLPELGNFGAYLTGMVRNLSFSYLRRNVIRSRVNELIKISSSDEDNSLEATLNYRETVEILNEAIEKLSDQQRIAYELCHGQGLKYHEAAEKMNISPETVHYHMKLALKSIREHFRKNAFTYHILFAYLFKK